jgi:fucose permease
MIFSFLGAALAPFVIMLREPARGESESVGSRGSATTTPAYVDRIGKLLRIRTLVLHYAATAVIMFALQGYVVWMPSFLERHRGFSLQEVSNLAGAATLVGGIVGGVIGAWLADWLYARDRRGRLAMQTGASLLAAPCMLVTVFAPGRVVIVLGLFAAMILLVTMFPILSAIIVDLVDPGDTGTAMSILLLAQTGVGFSLGPLAVGWLSDRTGSLALALLAPPISLVLVVLMGAIGMSWVRRDIAARDRRMASLA